MLSPEYYRIFQGVSISIISDVIARSTKNAGSSRHVIKGEAHPSLNELSPTAFKYYKALETLMRDASNYSATDRLIGGNTSPSINSPFSTANTRPSAMVPSMTPTTPTTRSFGSPFGEGTRTEPPPLPTSSPYKSPFNQQQSGGIHQGSSFGGGQYGGSSSSYGESQYGRQYDSPRYGESREGQSRYGGQSQYNNQPQYGDQPQYSQPRRSDPFRLFSILSTAEIPFEVNYQLSFSTHPIEFGSFFSEGGDMKGSLKDDYRRGYNNTLGDMPSSDANMFGGYQAEQSYGQDSQQAGMYQTVQIQHMRQQYITKLQRKYEILNKPPPESVESLTLSQLMEHDSRMGKQIVRGMNAWFYNNALTVGGGALGQGLDGNTGYYYVDRLCNLKSLPSHLREMRGQPWWDYSIEEVSQDSILGGSPAISIIGMIAMSMFSSMQDGIEDFDTKTKREKQEKKKRQMARLQRDRDVATTSPPSDVPQTKTKAAATTTTTKVKTHPRVEEIKDDEDRNEERKTKSTAPKPTSVRVKKRLTDRPPV